MNNPCLIHYGSFETIFLRRMCERFRTLSREAVGVARAIEHAVNLLSTIYAQVYFPTLSNGLKEIAGILGFKWSAADASGSRCVIWRHAWNGSRDPNTKEKLITYNAEDCEALVIGMPSLKSSHLTNRSSVRSPTAARDATANAASRSVFTYKFGGLRRLSFSAAFSKTIPRSTA